MSTTLIVVLAAVVVVPLFLAILFKVLWKVPAADEALIVTGFAASRSGSEGKTFKIVTGGTRASRRRRPTARRPSASRRRRR